MVTRTQGKGRVPNTPKRAHRMARPFWCLCGDLLDPLTVGQNLTFLRELDLGI